MNQHAHGALAVTADDEIQPLAGRHGAGHLHVARRVDAAQGVGAVVAHVRGGNHHVGLGAQLGQQGDRFGDGFAELDALDIDRQRKLPRVVGGQAHHGDLVATPLEGRVGREHALAVLVDTGREQGKVDPLALLDEHRGWLVELVVAHGRDVVADEAHVLEVGLGILQVGLGHAGVDVATVQQQAVAAGRGHLGTDAVDHRLARGHAVLAVGVGPEAAVVVVGVQDGQPQRRSLGRRGGRCGTARQQRQRQGRDGKRVTRLQGGLHVKSPVPLPPPPAAARRPRCRFSRWPGCGRGSSLPPTCRRPCW